MLLDSGFVAIDTACCCGGGACCDLDTGTCTITTEADCTGVYRGDGTVCDPNPCVCPCYFTDPDTGRFYLTKRYINTVDNSACFADTKTYLRFSDGAHLRSDCSVTSLPAPSCFTHGDVSQSVLLSESYDSECNDNQIYEDIPVGAYCFCTDTSPTGDFGTCGGVLIPRCDILVPPICPCTTPPTPPFSAFCGVVNTTVVYEDECFPSEGGACCNYDNSTCEFTSPGDCIYDYLGDGTACADCGF